VYLCNPDGSHKIFDSHTSVVAVAVNTESTKTLVGGIAFSEGVSNKTITGLKANLGLERSSLQLHEPSEEER